MKKKERSGTAGGGDSWRILLSRHVAAGKLGDGGCGLVGWVEGERTGMMKGGEQEQERGVVSGCGLAGAGGARDGRAPSFSFLLLLNFIFTAC